LLHPAVLPGGRADPDWDKLMQEILPQVVTMGKNINIVADFSASNYWQNNSLLCQYQL